MKKHSIVKVSGLAFIWGLLSPALAPAQEIVDITQNKDSLPLGRQLLLLEDADGSLKLEDVLALDSSKFQKSASETPNFGFSASVFWARGWIRNPEPHRKTVILEVGYGLLDSIVMYVEKNGTWKKRSGGDRQPFAARDILYRHTAYRLLMEPDQTYPLIFRFQTTSSVQFPVTVWHEKDFANSRLTEQFVYGLLYGLLAAMILYHLFLFFSTREASYVHFAAYLACISTGICSFYGHATQYMWFWSPWMANHIVPMSMTAAVTTAMLFTSSFLRGKEILPRFDKYLKSLAILGVILFLIAFSDNVQKVTRIGTVLSLVGAISSTVGGILAGRAGFRAARFFVLAWISFCVGVIAYGLKSLGLIESNFFTDVGLGIGTGLEALLFALALGDRISMLRNQRDTARSEQLEQAENQLQRLDEMKELATRLAEVSEAMSAHMSQVAFSTNEVFRAVSEAGDSIEIIGERAHDVERTANHIASSSAEVSTEWGRGQSAIEQTATIIVDIERESIKISKMVSNLLEKIEEVNGVIIAVRSVAEQSKVLSVNASIEAAEAGEFGRGFGVIAQEINSLAQESESATRYVSEVLSTIRSSLSEIVDAVKLGTERSSVGAEEVKKVRGFVRNLSQGMQITAEQAQKIAQSVSEQSKGFLGVVGATTMINRMAENNIDVVKKMEKTVKLVDKAVDNLSSLADQT